MLTDAIRDATGVTVRVELLVETDARGRRVRSLSAATGRGRRRRRPSSDRSSTPLAPLGATPATRAPPPGRRAR